MSSIRFGPITGQQAKWSRLAQREDKILLIVGRRDPIIITSEIKEDAESLIGAQRLVYKELNEVLVAAVSPELPAVRV